MIAYVCEYVHNILPSGKILLSLKISHTENIKFSIKIVICDFHKKIILDLQRKL